MEKTNYKKLIQTAKTFDELETLKEGFLKECAIQHNKIAAANMLGQIQNFGDAKFMFECAIPSLLKNKDGKRIINKFASIVKENASLKTLYAFHEGLKQNKTVETKKNYITEALSVTNTIDNEKYLTGLKDIISLLSETFKIIGDDKVLENVRHDKTSQLLGESLLYLTTTKKNIRNLNEYISHVNRVSEDINENTISTINVNSTLEEIVNEMKNKVTTVDSIFETENKEESFIKTKNICLEMISNHKKYATDEEIHTKLNEMEVKLTKKSYNFDSYTKDMLYMTELQEVLK